MTASDKDNNGADMTLERIFVIRGEDTKGQTYLQQLFWSNTEGWVGIHSASVFLAAEVKAGKFQLPVGGEWQTLKLALTEYTEWQDKVREEAVDDMQERCDAHYRRRLGDES
jgi:hypothetical protein